MRFRAIIILLALIFVLSGCNSRDKVQAIEVNETTIKTGVTVADPEAAVDAIYESLPEYTATSLTAYYVKNNLELNSSDVVEYHGKISDSKDGLADVIILLPMEEKREELQLSLSKYKEKRIAEFENYDILDAYSIAQNAVIYDQGEYLIMLMLNDNDAARKIIDLYIPL